MKNTIFILLGGKNLMKITTFLINLEDNHPNSEVRILVSKNLRKKLQLWLNDIQLNLNVNIEFPETEQKVMFNIFCYDFYLLNKLIEDNNVIIINNSPYMQSGLPLNKFTKDFGGLEIEDGLYSKDFAYFTNPSLVKDLVNKLKDKYEKICLPEIEKCSALLIQRAWCLYKKREFKNSGIKTGFLKIRTLLREISGVKYEIKDDKYNLDKLDFNILMRYDSYNNKKFKNDLFKKENGYLIYNNEKCSLMHINTNTDGVERKNNKFTESYIKLILDSRNNIRNSRMFWDNTPFTIKWCLRSFMHFSLRDEYLSNFLISTRRPNIYRIEHSNDSVIKLGNDNIYIYNYPTSAQFTPSLLSSNLVILAYPMKDEDISILDDLHINYYNLNMNLPQSIKKIIEIQKLDLKKETDLYSLGCHKSLILDDQDSEKKEYEEYLRNVSMSKYMIVYNDDKYNKCTQITEALAFGTIPILVKQNNIIINNDDFKEGIHYILADITEVENKIEAISEEEYNKLKQNCIDFYNKYESEKVFNKKLIRFFVSSYNNFIKF